MTFLTLLLVADAHATVSRITATAQSTNVLRYDLSVTTTERARVAIQIWPNGSSVTSGWTTDYTTADAKVGRVTVWGMAPGIKYNYRVLVDPYTGANYTDARVRNFTTGALPSTLPTLTATTYAGAPDFSYLMFHSDGSGVDDGGILIVDNTSTVRWYQTPPTAGETFSGSWYSEEENAMYAMTGMDRIVRYAMNGTMTLDLDISGSLVDYVHHEVVSHDGIVYVLTVRDQNDGTRLYAEDGIEGYDTSGNLVYEWWIGEDGGLDTTANPPYAWAGADYGYTEIWPGIQDWAHANSLQVRDEADGLKAYLSLRGFYEVIKVDMATGAIEWKMGQVSSSATSRANNDFSMDRSGVSSTWWVQQHHAHFEDDGTFVIYDNGGTNGTRGLEVSIDDSAMTVTIDRAVDFTALEDAFFDGVCDHVGSAFHTASGHMLMNCGPEQFIADFDSANALQWTLDINTSGTLWRGTPLNSIQ